METHVGHVRTYVVIYLSLLALTAATSTIAFIDLGEFNVIVALTIAVIKASLVAIFFMHLKDSLRLNWLAVGIGLFWLILLVGTTVSDVATRGWIGGGSY